jgi:hypothetical protein
MLTPIHTMLASWQLLQPDVTPLWICTPEGGEVKKAVPGAVLVAEAAIRPDGRVPRWQVSQVVDDGMCEPAPAGLVGGMPTMRAMPMKLVVALAAWWQLTQLLLMPAWLMSEPLNLAPLPTGSAVMDEPAP